MEDEPAGQSGFTLVELLVVMIVIGILATIAIPVFLSQRRTAHDSSTKADVTHVGQEIATYFVDNKGTLTLDFATRPGYVLVTDGTFSTPVRLTNGTAQPVSGGATNLGDPDAWCVALTDSRGAQANYSYSAKSGLATGIC